MDLLDSSQTYRERAQQIGKVMRADEGAVEGARVLSRLVNMGLTRGSGMQCPAVRWVLRPQNADYPLWKRGSWDIVAFLFLAFWTLWKLIWALCGRRLWTRTYPGKAKGE